MFGYLPILSFLILGLNAASFCLIVGESFDCIYLAVVAVTYFQHRYSRAERTLEQVCSSVQYQKVFSRLSQLSPRVEHLIMQLGAESPFFLLDMIHCNQGIPIAYPRMVFLETALGSKLNPLVALGKAGRLGSLGLSGFANKFNADAELLDDLVNFTY